MLTPSFLGVSSRAAGHTRSPGKRNEGTHGEKHFRGKQKRGATEREAQRKAVGKRPHMSAGTAQGVTWAGLGMCGGRSGFWGKAAKNLVLDRVEYLAHPDGGAEKVQEGPEIDSSGRCQGGGGDLRVSESMLLEAVAEALWEDEP